MTLCRHRRYYFGVAPLPIHLVAGLIYGLDFDSIKATLDTPGVKKVCFHDVNPLSVFGSPRWFQEQSADLKCRTSSAGVSVRHASNLSLWEAIPGGRLYS